MNKVDLRIPEPLLKLIQKPKRIKIVVGGRGSGKSIGVGDIMLMFADQGERICCTREFQNSIDDSVHENLKQEIIRLGVNGFLPKANDITTATGGRIFYKGLARNITSLKSLAGVKRLWIEEGESVSENSLKVLTPSVRSPAAMNGEETDPPEIWVTMNRASRKGAIAKKYLSRAERALAKTGYYEDDLIMVVQINWNQNPWFPPELEQERLDDKENLSDAEYGNIWGGEYYDEVKGSIIPVTWFDAAIDAHIKLGITPRGAKIASFDPSDEGGDNKGYAERHGILFTDISDSAIGDVNDGADWATEKAIASQADCFIWDCDGMGISLKRQINQSVDGKKIDVEMFKGSEGPENPEQPYQERAGKSDNKNNRQTFKNRRAQYYWMLRDRFYATYRAVEKKEYIDPDELISISSGITDIEGLRAEVCRIPKKPSGLGLIQIMSKIEMAKEPYCLPSPNRADSMMMSMISHTSKAADVPSLQFESLWS